MRGEKPSVRGDIFESPRTHRKGRNIWSFPGKYGGRKGRELSISCLEGPGAGACGDLSLSQANRSCQDRVSSEWELVINFALCRAPGAVSGDFGDVRTSPNGLLEPEWRIQWLMSFLLSPSPEELE